MDESLAEAKDSTGVARFLGLKLHFEGLWDSSETGRKSKRFIEHESLLLESVSVCWLHYRV